MLFTDRWRCVDVRDHIFSYDLLGVRQNTQNLELTTGFAYYCLSPSMSHGSTPALSRGAACSAARWR